MIETTLGTKLENVTYYLRTGAYIIVIENDQLAVVKTPNGYFLLGGGIEHEETHEQCLTRECLEEIGYTIQIDCYLGMAQEYRTHPVVGYRHSIQHYYSGKLLKKVKDPIELDHHFEWLDLRNVDLLKVESQRWAVEQFVIQKRDKTIEK